MCYSYSSVHYTRTRCVLKTKIVKAVTKEVTVRKTVRN